MRRRISLNRASCRHPFKELDPVSTMRFRVGGLATTRRRRRRVRDWLPLSIMPKVHSLDEPAPHAVVHPSSRHCHPASPPKRPSLVHERRDGGGSRTDQPGLAVLCVVAAACASNEDKGSARETTSSATPSGPPVGVAPETDYLLDLDTGEMTPLPEDIVGTRTWWQLCSVTGRVEASLRGTG